MVAFVFPGQGSQKAGMGQKLYDTFKPYKYTMEEAQDLLSLPLVRAINDGAFVDTVLTQLSIFAVSMATLQTLRVEGKLPMPAYMAGHSLGEYSALTAAGCFSFKDALNLVKVRATAMKHADQNGAMGAIIGLDESKVSSLLEPDTFIANDNATGQLVISGKKESVIKVLDEAKKSGARLVKCLDVKGAFHCPLMLDAQKLLKDYLEGVSVQKPKVPYYPNVLAEPVCDEHLVKDYLVRQMTQRVRFRETIIHMHDHSGVKVMYEIGPSNVLKGLIERTRPETFVLSVNEPQDIEECLKEVAIS